MPFHKSSDTPFHTPTFSPFLHTSTYAHLSIQDVCWIDHEFVFYEDTSRKIPEYLKISNFGGRDVDYRIGNNIRSGFFTTPQTEWKPRVLHSSMPQNVSYDDDKAYLFVESSYADNFGNQSCCT